MPRSFAVPDLQPPSGQAAGSDKAAAIGETWAGVFGRLESPWPVAALTSGALLFFACNVNERVGHRAEAFKHHYPHAFMLFVVLAVGCRFREVSREFKAALAREFAAALPWFALFCILIGVDTLVSNGTIYAEMATNYWNTDLFNSTSRRLGLPALANVIGVERNGYIFFWYAMLFAGFALAQRYLRLAGLSGLERISVLTSSIFAYALIGPGYNEVFVFALGLFAIQFRLGLTEKIIVAATMIATHETATPFVGLAIILQSDAGERREWIAILGLFYIAYLAAYLFAWHDHVIDALHTAAKPKPNSLETSQDLLLEYPLMGVCGVLMAYKLYWVAVLDALRRPGTRAMACAVLVSLVLVYVGSDASRLVQFGSLAFLISMGALLPTWPKSRRTALCLLNLAIPSLYLATNSQPLWGYGLYSIYLKAAAAAGLDWGGRFTH